MKLLSSLSECCWITGGVAKLKADIVGTVAHCIPPIFPCYAKIFHPIYEDLAIQNEDLTWQQEDSATPKAFRPETDFQRALAEVLSRSTLVYGGARPGSRPMRIRWTELARRVNLSFVPTLSAWSFTRQFPGRSWPSYLIGPQEGNLDSIDRDALASVLRRHSDVDRILFRFDLLATTDWTDDSVFKGTLNELSLFPDDVPEVQYTPTHWFPEDRSWLVCTDYDLTFALVGGSEDLIRELMDHPTLECVPVQFGTRIDKRADLESSVHRG